MIVYSERKQTLRPSEILADLLIDLEAAPLLGHEQPTEWLIRFGEMEAAVVDHLCPRVDAGTPAAEALRRAGVLLGRVFYRSWTQAPNPSHLLSTALRELQQLDLPDSVQSSVPEGYAYYGLYPEMYAEAAVRFWKEKRPERVAVVGIRGIGASLSAVVCGALEDLGCETLSFTVRPRGHAFDRQLCLLTADEGKIRGLQDRYFLVVDEGPGLSGSSFSSVTEKLSGLGIADERMILFPSWEPDWRSFVSERARERWHTHTKYVVDFEALQNKLLPKDDVVNISGGQWRSLFWKHESEYPAVQPQHERRKYLQCRERLLLKFAGLGQYGKRALVRAEQLAAAHFTPPVVGLENGFLLTRFLEGRPLRAGCYDQSLLDQIAAYLSYVKRNFSTNREIPFDSLMEMMRVNVSEGLGEEWAQPLDRFAALRPVISDNTRVASDSRMLPHEWIATAHGYIKTDAVEHHDDHFFPGLQDIAWDIAGTIIEFQLDSAASAYLVNQYESLSGDDGLCDRLAFYRIAYLAFRFGYTSLCGGEFRLHAERYRRLLQAELGS